MVTPGSLGKYTPSKPSAAQYTGMVLFFIVYAISMGYYAGVQPTGQWRYFSYHPLLMTIGMIGIPGISVMTRKLGGYNNTKIHAMLGWLGNITSLAGCYFIYNNKELNGYQHLKSNHALAGIFVMLNCLALGMAGSVFLHPDIGIAKTNKTIRLVHTYSARVILVIAWFNSIAGLYQLTSDTTTLLLYGVPLALVLPFSLL